MDVRRLFKGAVFVTVWVVVITGAFLLAGGATLGRRTASTDMGNIAASADAGAAATRDSATTTSTTTAGATTTTTMPPVVTTTTAAPAETPTADAVETKVATLTATLSGGTFTLNGVVPDEAAATRLVQAANVAYGPAVTTDLMVSSDVEAPVWLAGAHQGITLIPMISEGSIVASGDEVTLTGASPNEQYLAAFQQAVAATFGVQDVALDVEITNLAPPTFNARLKDGTMTLSGILPSSQIREVIGGGARAAYGNDNVVDNTVVGEGLYTSYWMYTMPGVFQLFTAFPDYEIDVTNGITTGSLNDGANFASGSAELSPDTQAVLNIGIALLVRDQSLGIKVTGHTDSVGSNALNQRLSEARAQAVIEYMIAAGVDPARLLAVGRGEEEPIASNDTSAGKASNRRVEFEFGPVLLVTAAE